jgi:HEPN domain-containing protein
MSEPRKPPEDPQEWLNRARSNLIRAGMLSEGVYLEDLCFDAQQAAEKAIKAVLVHRNVWFPYIHDLARLITLLEQSGQSVPTEVKQAAALTRYAVTTRYPGVIEPVTQEEYEKAIAIAENVVQWATHTIT